ncbi:hypothetical protein P9F84_20400 [Bacillus subtilis]|uniref:hypothetical protein n=1 Tax=Bacillus sp. ZHX3 TaxID=2841656 RepID=UPI000909CE10|nr:MULTISPECIES: hypothetical protein [Bacillus]API41387.1 hypothetical protein BSR08_02105 [Bacillus subtilis]ARI87729.1 hypothetical protein B7470_17550 [Bacillus subtilis]AVL06104.1 hypothetical protein BS21228_18130 [Bacillus subtilis]AYK79457.1 hypothetical protein D9C20_15825 [Bacillus subtilis subsp. subtilis]AYK81584.1 hypothetical protein D9C18_04175 [Bacillus subtilis subsp. subtilis]
MGALFLNLKPGEYLKKQYKTKKLVEKTSFSLQAEGSFLNPLFYAAMLRHCSAQVKQAFAHAWQ